MLKHIKNYLIAGVLVWLPLFVTFVLVRFLIEILDYSVALLPTQYQPQQLIGVKIPGLGLIFTLAILVGTGMLVTNIIGNRLLGLWERALDRIPFIRSVYSAVKQVTQTLIQPSDTSFRRVVLIEYPRKNCWAIAFVTSEKFTHNALDGPICTVFLPTTPNPTSGFILLIPKHETIELDISVEEALKMVVSLGVISPACLNVKGARAQGTSAA